ncbi:MAG: helix-turn-helix transcriptional regulator [Clostridia bacterium]|nr:helix-turn-helix transcriptional regulator [Clostridia bacterium]
MKTRAHEYGNANVIGKKVEQLRKSAGIKQKDFIAKLQLFGLDINPTSYSKLEGQVRNATDKEVYAIAKVLGVNIQDIYNDDFDF